MRTGISIRIKIVALIAGSLTLSLMSYLYVGTNLIIEDKISYIYDFNHSEINSAAQVIEHDINNSLRLGTVIGNLLSKNRRKNSNLEKLYKQHTKKDNRQLGIVYLRPSTKSKFVPAESFGNKKKMLRALIKQLGWKPSDFESAPYLVGSLYNKMLPVGSKTFDQNGNPLAFITLIKLSPEAISGFKNSEIYLVDPVGKPIVTKKNDSFEIPESETSALFKTLISESLDSGVRDWNSGENEFILSYQRLSQGKLMLVSFLPRSIAFAAAKSLAMRSLALGLSILFLAVGVTLIFVKKLTMRLRQMSHATKRVQEGHFETRVEEVNSNDEIGSLSRSFNAMAEKIGELIIQTADKARMEKELETAQEVQNRLFPLKSFDHPHLLVAGKSLPATECAGDWWQYEKIGDRIIVVIGDVTGHGVSAALVTAAAHGAFALLVRLFRQAPHIPPKVSTIMEHLNTSITATAGGSSTMTFLASVIDLKTGVMSISNASHRPLYLYRPSLAGKSNNIVKRFKPLMDARCDALGMSPDLEVKTASYRLHAGDMLFWYTDGLVECPNPAGKVLTTTNLVRALAEHHDGLKGDPNEVSEALMKQFTDFMGTAYSSRPDDITFVVGKIPDTAKFVEITKSDKAA